MKPLSAYNLDSGEPALTFLHDQIIAETEWVFTDRCMRTGRCHKPSPKQWAALGASAHVLEMITEGTAANNIYVSSLAPGIGKSSVIAAYLRILTGVAKDPSFNRQGPLHEDVSVLVLIARHDGIREFVEGAGLKDEDIGIFTADEELNNWRGRGANARILVSTQDMLWSRTKYRRLSQVSEFFWKGEPRTVRIWDEAIIRAKAQTVTRDNLSSLIKPARRTYRSLGVKLDKMFTELADWPDGKLFPVPDFTDGNGGVSVSAFLETASGYLDREDQDAALELWDMGGKLVDVKRDGMYGNTILTYKERLHEDFTPMLVYDASATIRGTYSLWNECDDCPVPIQLLPVANKDYSNLTIHFWERAGGKAGYRGDRGAELVDGISNAILSRPANEEWLIVYHLPGNGMLDLPPEISRKIALQVGQKVTDPDRIKSIHWGIHDLTNEYSGIPNIILAGTRNYRASSYVALGRASAKRKPGQAYTTDMNDRIRLGEHLHNYLQAACRGAIRLSKGAGCPLANLYLIAPVASKIREHLPDIFPNAKVMLWVPIIEELNGRVGEAWRYLEAERNANPEAQGRVTFRKIAKALGMTARDFKVSVRQHPKFRRKIAQEGIKEVRVSKASWNTAFEW